VGIDVALAAGSTVVAMAFGISTHDRWLRRRAPHDLAWTISLAIFSVGAAALWWAEARGWSIVSFRVFFLAGAVLNVPWLALGSVYLLAGRVWGDRIRWWLVGLSGAAFGVVLVSPADPVEVSGHDLPKGSEIFGVAPRVFAAVGSGLAATVILAGSVWSIVRLLRGRTPGLSGTRRQVVDPARLVGGNALIALGTIVLSASGTLAGRLGEDRAFSVTLLVGVVILFAGFLVSSVRRVERTAQQLADGVVR